MKSHVVEMVLPLKLSPAHPNGREKFTGQTHDFCGKPKLGFTVWFNTVV